MMKKLKHVKTISYEVTCSRRSFLLATLASTLMIQLPGCDLLNNDMTSGTSKIPEWLLATISHPGEASYFGRIYLQIHPQENNRSMLTQAIEEAVVKLHDKQVANSAEITFDRLDRAIRREYTRAEVINLQGWLLSRTEARLYALTALENSA